MIHNCFGSCLRTLAYSTHNTITATRRAWLEVLGGCVLRRWGSPRVCRMCSAEQLQRGKCLYSLYIVWPTLRGLGNKLVCGLAALLQCWSAFANFVTSLCECARLASNVVFLCLHKSMTLYCINWWLLPGNVQRARKRIVCSCVERPRK